MKKSFKFLSLILSGAAMLFGCKSTDIPSKKTNILTVELNSNPTTGYSWQCTLEDSSVAELTAQSYEQKNKDKQLVGAGGTETFIFTAKKAGTTKVFFTYKRAWEESEFDKKETAVITVNQALVPSIKWQK